MPLLLSAPAAAQACESARQAASRTSGAARSDYTQHTPATAVARARLRLRSRARAPALQECGPAGRAAGRPARPAARGLRTECPPREQRHSGVTQGPPPFRCSTPDGAGPGPGPSGLDSDAARVGLGVA
jgi:hypothetical protein